MAGHGYACVRVDLRGTGDSEGVLTDEYLESELLDAEEILAWLADRTWSSGRAGMMGISWGASTPQVAARRPPSLGAIAALSFSDDRYADDVHYMGGCLLTDNLSWASTMFAHTSCPPDPMIVGERWRDMWHDRLDYSGLWLEQWLRHQRRDAYWRHGSVAEDYSDVQCPVLAVSGWADGYSNAVFRALANLEAPVRAHRPLVPQVPPPRRARSGDRLPPGAGAVVGPLAEGRGQRDHGRAEPAHLDAGDRAALHHVRGAAGPLGRRARLAVPRIRVHRHPLGRNRIAPRANVCSARS